MFRFQSLDRENGGNSGANFLQISEIFEMRGAFIFGTVSIDKVQYAKYN